MKSYEAMSKCLGIQLSAEVVGEFIKELSCHAGEVDLLLYEGYKLAQLFQPVSTEATIQRLAFLKKCEALGICDGDEQVTKTNEQKD